MKVTYRTTIDDYIAYCLFTAKGSAAPRNSIIWGMIGLTVIFGSLSAVFALIEDLWPCGIAVSAFGLLILALYPMNYRATVQHNIRKLVRRKGSRGIVGEITLILTETLLVEITETTRTEARWQDMADVVEDGDYTYILVTGMSAAILHKQAFESDEEYEAVRDFAMARFGEASHENTIPEPDQISTVFPIER